MVDSACCFSVQFVHSFYFDSGIPLFSCQYTAADGADSDRRLLALGVVFALGDSMDSGSAVPWNAGAADHQWSGELEG